MPNNEFGDFQTNEGLARRVVSLVAGLSRTPLTVIEPTCGEGNFIRACLDAFPGAVIHGLEVQVDYVQKVERRFQFCPKFILHRADYFQFEWDSLIEEVAKPVWVIGNPPWVTNTLLTKIESTNLPKKSPQAHLRGFETQTGKSNFDISKSMIRDWFRWCAACDGTLAVICKTSVARKVLQWWWKQNEVAPFARIHLIDAKMEFGVTVSACVFICSFEGTTSRKACDLYDTIEAPQPTSTFGLVDGFLVADEPRYRAGRPLLGKARPQWRSGIKHDAGNVLELTEKAGEFRNKLGKLVQLEISISLPASEGIGSPSARRPPPPTGYVSATNIHWR